jgi:hypothetical protein
MWNNHALNKLTLMLSDVYLVGDFSLPRSTFNKETLLRPQGAYMLKKNGRKCQSGTLNHQNGQNDVLIIYCTGDWLAKLGLFQLVLITVT